MVLEVDKVATLVHHHIGGLSNSAHGLLSNATRLRSRGVGARRRHLASLEEVLDCLRLVVLANGLDQPREVVVFLFLSHIKAHKSFGRVRASASVCVSGNPDRGLPRERATNLSVADEELAGVDDTLGIFVKTKVLDAVRVDVGHGLLDLLVFFAVVLSCLTHAMLIHQLVDREFLQVLKRRGESTRGTSAKCQTIDGVINGETYLSIRVDSSLVDDRVGD